MITTLNLKLQKLKKNMVFKREKQNPNCLIYLRNRNQKITVSDQTHIVKFSLIAAKKIKGLKRPKKQKQN